MKENRKSIWQRSWHPVGGSVAPGEGSGKGQSDLAAILVSRAGSCPLAFQSQNDSHLSVYGCQPGDGQSPCFMERRIGADAGRGRISNASLRARGERLDMAAFIPPRIPDEQNLAMTPLLKPLFEFEFDRTPGRNGLSWRDTNAMARLNRLRLDPGPPASGISRPVPGDWAARAKDEPLRMAGLSSGNPKAERVPQTSHPSAIG